MTILLQLGCFAIIGIFILEVAAIIVRTKPWLTERQRFFKGLVAQWQFKMFEDETTRRFLLEHEVPRFDNLISYNEQRREKLVAKTKSPGYRNNEQDKILIQTLTDNIEAFKEAKNADIVLSTKTKNARALLLAKVDFIKRNMFNSAIPAEPEIPKLESMEEQESAETHE